MRTNSREYWDGRFRSGDWVAVGGPSQTRDFAQAQLRHMSIAPDFAGSLLDFGCGMGDAFPVYHQQWPAARLIGVDFSEDAVARCTQTYGDIATFVRSDHITCPEADVIISSNVMEHLEDDIAAVDSLAGKCRDLYIIVPYREQHLIDEHLRAYDRESFAAFQPVDIAVFPSRGWSQYGLRAVWWEFGAKNLLRPLFGKTWQRRRLQVLFHMRGRR